MKFKKQYEQIPKNWIISKFHGLDNLFLQLAASNATQIMMQNVSEALSGEFTCEVTVANTFESVPRSGILYVYGK